MRVLRTAAAPGRRGTHDDGRGPHVSEVLVRTPPGARRAGPVLWVALGVLGLEAAAGLAGVSVLSYRAVTIAGFGQSPGSTAISRTAVIVALLALVAATVAMATAIMRHRIRGGRPSRLLVGAAATVLVVHAIVALGCLVRGEWAPAAATLVAGALLGGAWAHCLRHRG